MYSLPFFGVSQSGDNVVDQSLTIVNYLQTFEYPPEPTPASEIPIVDSLTIVNYLQTFDFEAVVSLSSLDSAKYRTTTSNVEFTFKVVRDKSDVATSVGYIVKQFGSNPASESDFVGDIYPSGTITFNAGEIEKVISVFVKSSNIPEGTKQFIVELIDNTEIVLNEDFNSVVGTIFNGDSINPSVVSFSPALWLDAADSTTITQSNGSVSQWSDKSINLNHLVQATASNQPTYENSFVRFTSTRFLAITVRQVFANTTQGSVFFVGNQAGMTRTGWGRFGVNQSNYTPYDGALYDSFLATSRPQITGNVIPHPMPNSIISYENTGSQLIARRNGTQVGIVNTTYRIPLANTSEQRVGGTMGNFDHQEILMFPRVLTQAEREVIEGYLAWKWGLVASLPIDHPYKNTAPF